MMSQAPNAGHGMARRLAPTLANCSLVIVLCLGAIVPAPAKDLNVLVRITYAAFLAEQGSSMCNLPRLPLSADDRIVFAGAKNYANWIKQQISTGLGEQDVRFVLTSAATRAHEEMLQVTEVLKSNPPDVETAELYRWCTGTMKGIAENVLATYANQPDVIEQIIKKAKVVLIPPT